MCEKDFIDLVAMEGLDELPETTAFMMQHRREHRKELLKCTLCNTRPFSTPGALKLHKTSKGHKLMEQQLEEAGKKAESEI